MIVLGVETSCDETSAAIVRDGIEVQSSIVASQADLHAKYGGVVPEVASRKHLEVLLPVVLEALSAADCDLGRIDAIAVTNRPGLLGALLMGVTAAKTLAYVLEKPLIGVHHIEGHIYSAVLAAPDLLESLPAIVLVVSGGHTQLIRIAAPFEYEVLGATRDDAAGEAFDKCARLLGLPYPGGPNLAKLAAGGEESVRFPQAQLGDSLEFSFSGLKTAVRTFVRRNASVARVEDIAASVQAAIVAALVEKARAAMRTVESKTLCLVGGVAANAELRSRLARASLQDGWRLVTPPPELCTDNAAMIASAGYFRLTAGELDDLSLDTLAAAPLAGLCACTTSATNPA